MKITYDKNADAMYIEIQEGEFFANKKTDSETIIDLDKDGNILGIEILNVSKRIPKNFISDIRIKNFAIREKTFAG